MSQRSIQLVTPLGGPPVGSAAATVAKIPDPLESISEHEHNCYLLMCKVDLVPASFNLIL